MPRFAIVLALLLAILGPTPGLGQSSLPAEEFLGPFSSWTQVQCGGADDTAMLQSALNALGTSGTSPVLYIKAGTCKITRTLTLSGKEFVTLLGSDPGSTSIVWASPNPGTMLTLAGVSHSRFGRLTWDHGGVGGLIYEGAWSGSGCCFPTDNRHEDEIFRGMIDQPGSAAFLGGRKAGDAETTWMRAQFIGPAQVGIFLNNYNVLNHWIWDSLFSGVRWGVTSTTESGTGAGGYAVNRSVFLNSQSADLGMSNTNFFSARWNYSRGSAQFIAGGPIGASPAPWTVQGNVVLDTPDDHNIIDMGNPGPLLLLDNTFRSGAAHINVRNPYADASGEGDITSLGNTFATGSPFERHPATRLRSVDDALGASVGDPGQPPPPATPQSLGRPVFEPASRDSAGIQSAIDQAVAAGPRAIVHLPYGDYSIGSTIEVPANATIQITGDGQDRTKLGASGASGALVHFAGPTKAIIRDLSLHGNNQVQGLSLTNVNQPNGVIHTEGLIGAENAVGVLVDAVNQAAIDLLDNQTSATSAADFRLRNGARATVFNGAGSGSTGSVYDLRDSSTLVVQTMYFENPKPVQFIAPNSSGTLVLDTGKLQGAPGTATDFSSFNGLSTIQNIGVSDKGPVKATANMLSLGVIAGAGSQSGSAGSYAIWAPRTDTGGGGSRQAPEQSAAIGDESTTLRQHEEPLRSAVPRPLGDNGDGVTDFHLYRVSGDHLTVLFAAQG